MVMGLAFSRSLAQSCADRRLATSAARHRALEPRARRVRSAPRSSGWFGCGAAQLGSVRMPHGSGPFGCRAAQLGFVRTPRPRSSGSFGCRARAARVRSDAARLGSVRRLRTTLPRGAARRDLRVLSSIAASLDFRALWGSFGLAVIAPGFLRVSGSFGSQRRSGSFGFRHMFPFLARRPERPLGRHARAPAGLSAPAQAGQRLNSCRSRVRSALLLRGVVRLRHTLFRAVPDSALV
jgi:hypothetical protein